MRKNRKIIYYVMVLFFIGECFLLSNPIDNLNLMTEEYPPYNYLDQNTGSLKGITTEIVEYILKDNESKLKKEDIKVMPWARAYRETLEKKNSVLYSMTLTDEREPLFKWVGPIIDTRIALNAKKSKKIKIQSIEDMKKYRIGVVRDGVAPQLLIKEGLTEEDLDQITYPKQNVYKLYYDRIDIWAYEENVAMYMIKAIDDPEKYENVYILYEGELYIAFNIKTSDEIINLFQNSLDKLKKEDVEIYEEIISKYVK